MAGIVRETDYAGGWFAATVAGTAATVFVFGVNAQIISGNFSGGVALGLIMCLGILPIWVFGTGFVGLPAWWAFERLGLRGWAPFVVLGAVLVGGCWFFWNYSPDNDPGMGKTVLRYALEAGGSGAFAGAVSGWAAWKVGYRKMRSAVA